MNESRIFISLNRKECEPLLEKMRQSIVMDENLNVSNTKLIILALQTYIERLKDERKGF